MGPMVYLLPLYSPLRMIEEISILDHLSNGRAEIGVGRGVSPYELGFHNVDASKSREIFIDAFDCMVEGLTHDRLTYHGPFYDYDDVPVVLHPLQKPYPAMWYGSSNTTGATWAGERGLHFASNGATDVARANIAAYVDALAKRGTGVEHPHPEFPGGGAIGVSRQIVVADTDADARRIAQGPHEHIHHNQMFLRREALARADMKSRPGYVDAPSAGDLDKSLAEGSSIIGSPETVRAAIEAQIETLGINYLICYFMFGTMTLKTPCARWSSSRPKCGQRSEQTAPRRRVDDLRRRERPGTSRTSR